MQYACIGIIGVIGTNITENKILFINETCKLLFISINRFYGIKNIIIL